MRTRQNKNEENHEIRMIQNLRQNRRYNLIQNIEEKENLKHRLCFIEGKEEANQVCPFGYQLPERIDLQARDYPHLSQ